MHFNRAQELGQLRFEIGMHGAKDDESNKATMSGCLHDVLSSNRPTSIDGQTYIHCVHNGFSKYARHTIYVEIMLIVSHNHIMFSLWFYPKSFMCFGVFFKWDEGANFGGSPQSK